MLFLILHSSKFGTAGDCWSNCTLRGKNTPQVPEVCIQWLLEEEHLKIIPH